MDHCVWEKLSPFWLGLSIALLLLTLSSLNRDALSSHVSCALHPDFWEDVTAQNISLLCECQE